MEKHGVELDPSKTKTAGEDEKRACPVCAEELEKDANGEYMLKCPVHGTEPFERKP